MGPRNVNPKIRKSEKPDPNANGYPNVQAYWKLRLSSSITLGLPIWTLNKVGGFYLFDIFFGQKYIRIYNFCKKFDLFI